MRLIDADAIQWDVDGVGFIPVIGKDEIDAMPEAVVRCEDCRCFDRGFCTKLSFIPCGTGDYCSWGERREDG